MRKILGTAVLLAGVGGLGWWGATHQARKIEAGITAAASGVASQSLHGVTTSVSGRDITATGLVDSEAEGAALLAALNEVPGQRVVRHDFTVLAAASPYITRLDKAADGSLGASGALPSEAARRELSGLIGAAAADPALASGAPPGHLSLVTTGGQALALLTHGQAEVRDGALVLTGEAPDAPTRDAVLALLAGSKAQATLSLPIPPEWSFDFTPATGGTVAGQLPAGLDLAGLATTLALGEISQNADSATQAPAPLPALFAALARWLPDLEHLHVRLPAGAPAEVTAGLGKGADTALITEAMRADLGPDVMLDLHEITPDVPDGTTRTNAATGLQERLAAGYWLPVRDFEVSTGNCAAETNTLLGAQRVNFVTGSARLDASALRALNGLAAVILPCAGAGLQAEIGGHTDNTGDAATNLALSKDRAEAVRAALLARGVPAGLLAATGYGDTQPATDNATEVGRAANRRTTISWSQQATAPNATGEE